jgi:hypothetical protein
MLHWQKETSEDSTIYLKSKSEKIYGLIQHPLVRQLTANAPFVSSIVQNVRHTRNSGRWSERCFLRRAQCRKLITVQTVRQTVADPGRVDEFQLTKTTEKSSMFARTPRLHQTCS